MTIATTTSTNVSRRLPNSMTPWMPISGVATSESPVHCGHVGQPRPEPGEAHQAAGRHDPDLHDEGRPGRGDHAAIHPVGQPVPEAPE